MPPTKPQSNPQKKPPKRIKILQVKGIERKPFWSEYFYPILGALFCLITVFLSAAGLRFDEAAVVALWIVAIIFFARQVKRFVKGEPALKNEEKKPLASIPEQKYKPPELPRVSKDFSPMPPAGDKRYPPPSPFIKPPK
jgi:LAS superfamily LD-carboxypeptidase LdcB